LRDALFFLGCGIVRQVGVPYRRGDLVPRPVPGTDRFQSEAERLVGCLRRLGRPDLRDDRWWDLNLSEGERREADELLGGVRGPAPLLAVSVGTKVDANDWTEANWLSLIRRLSRRLPGHGLVALGSADESDRSRRMLSEWDGPTLDLCGRVRPRVSAAVLRLCTLFIGHNSGPMHLASSVGTPCVAIFSGRDLPGVWFPRGEGHRVLFRPTECRGCGLVVCRDRQKECIVSIGVNEVFRAVVGLLPGDTPSCREGNPSHV
jgi:ADP-heptose:LPS heptosyltransferase